MFWRVSLRKLKKILKKSKKSKNPKKSTTATIGISKTRGYDMAYPRKRSRQIDSDEDGTESEDHEDQLIENKRIRKSVIPSYAESGSEGPDATTEPDNEGVIRAEEEEVYASDGTDDLKSQSFSIKLKIGVAAARSFSEKLQTPNHAQGK